MAEVAKMIMIITMIMTMMTMMKMTLAMMMKMALTMVTGLVLVQWPIYGFTGFFYDLPMSASPVATMLMMMIQLYAAYIGC